MELVEIEELSNDENASQDYSNKYRPENGLSSAEAATLLSQYGPNALPEKTKPKVCE